jgi:hypothetical protein
LARKETVTRGREDGEDELGPGTEQIGVTVFRSAIAAAAFRARKLLAAQSAHAEHLRHVACRSTAVKHHDPAVNAARSRYLAFISGEGLQPAVRKEIVTALRQPAWERYRAAAFSYLRRLSRQVRRP